MILILGQNAAWQKVCMLHRLQRGDVNRVQEVRAFASSKGPNVARALRALRGDAKVLGYAGGATGELVRQSLQAEGVSAELIRIAADTRVCTTLAEESGVSTEVIEPAPAVTARERDELRERFRRLLPSARLFVIAGSAVAGETPDCYAELVREARARAVVTLMDAACPQAIDALAAGPQIVKVNLKELQDITGTEVASPAQRVRAWRALAERHGICWFFATMGAAGMEGFDGRVLLHAEPPAVKVRNPIGSGDAATAGAGWAVHQMLAESEPREVFSSRACLQETLEAAAAMGTANCLNPINGRVEEADYIDIRSRIRVTEVPLP